MTRRPLLALSALVALGLWCDEALADEPWIELRAPRDLPRRVCSITDPVCVSGEAGVSSATLRHALERAESTVAAGRAWFDLPVLPVEYRSRKVEVRVRQGDLRPRVVVSHREDFGGFDHASGFLETGDAALASCAGEALFYEGLFRLFALATNPAADDASAVALARTEASIFDPCGRPLEEGDTRAREGRLLSASFTSWLDRTASDDRKRVPFSLRSLSPTKTPLEGARWRNEPDLLDVLRESTAGLYGMNTGLGDALSRYFSDEIQEGRLSPTWSIPFPVSPRRLIGESLRPGGAGLVAVEAEGKRGLRIEVEWESPAEMRVSARVVSRDGSAKIISLPAGSRATHAQGSIVDLSDAARVDVLVVHAGEWYGPIDPDGALNPRGYAVSVAGE